MIIAAALGMSALMSYLAIRATLEDGRDII